MKQMEVTEKTIGEYTFYIRPFPAFTASNISGELSAVLVPLISSLVPALQGTQDGGGDIDISKAEMGDVLPSVSAAFGSLSGDRFESLMKRLLITYKNISVSGEATDGEAKLLTYDLANEVFCGEVQDMFILCWEVIKINYSGFFGKIKSRFGNLTGFMEKMTDTKNGENSTTVRLTSSNSDATP